MDSKTVRAYLDRIGANHPRQPDTETLDELVECHVTTVPFENVDCFLRTPLHLGEGAVDKIVRRERGGGCYELNSAFGLLLAALGYSVTPLGARVYHGERLTAPLRHLVLRVDTPEPHLVDVGFGFGRQRNSRAALRIEDPSPQNNAQGTYAVTALPNGDVDVVCDEVPLYRVEPTHRELGDFDPTLWWFLNDAGSPLFQALFCVLPILGGRVSLKNDRLTHIVDGEKTTTLLENPSQVREALVRSFGIVVDEIPDFMAPPEKLADMMHAQMTSIA